MPPQLCAQLLTMQRDCCMGVWSDPLLHFVWGSGAWNGIVGIALYHLSSDVCMTIGDTYTLPPKLWCVHDQWWCMYGWRVSNWNLKCGILLHLLPLFCCFCCTYVFYHGF